MKLKSAKQMVAQKCKYPAHWTKEDYDYILLAGTVAENMSNGTFADMIDEVLSGTIPTGASSDFGKLQMQDTDAIADTMLYLHDYFCNERWGIVMEFATALLENGRLGKKAITEIANRLCGVNRNIGRIARLMKQRKIMTFDEQQNE